MSARDSAFRMRFVIAGGVLACGLLVLAAETLASAPFGRAGVVLTLAGATGLIAAAWLFFRR